MIFLLIAGGCYLTYKLVKSPIQTFKDTQDSQYQDKRVVRLYQPTNGYYLNHGSLSPFCLKLEAFLKFAQIPYESINKMGQNSPTGKVPYIEHDGQLIADSSDIIQYLENCLVESQGLLSNRSIGQTYLPTSQLSKDQVSRGHLLQMTLENHFYFVIVYQRWLHNEENYQLYSGILFENASVVRWAAQKPFKNYLKGMLWNQVYSQGIARHSIEKIVQAGYADLDAIASMVPTDQKYLFSDTLLTSYDATLYGFLCNTIYGPNLKDDLGVKKYIGDNHPHLIDYVERIRDEYFSRPTPGNTTD